MPNLSDYVNLSAAVYTVSGAPPAAPQGWTTIATQTTANGMQAAAFQNNTTKQIVIAYEGTNLANTLNAPSYALAQAGADYAIAKGSNPAANGDALAFAQKVAAAAGGNPIYVTGHSLGGEEAEFVAATASKNQLVISGGATFGAPGVPQLLPSQANVPNMTNYIDPGDGAGAFVPVGGAHVGTVVSVGNQETAVIEQNLIANDTTGSNTVAAVGLMLASHLLSNYANDLDVTLPPSSNVAGSGAADAMEFITLSGSSHLGASEARRAAHPRM